MNQAKLMDLPEEVLLKIMCGVDSASSVAILSETCVTFRQILMRVLASSVRFRVWFIRNCLFGLYDDTMYILTHRPYLDTSGRWLLPYCNCYTCWYKKFKKMCPLPMIAVFPRDLVSGHEVSTNVMNKITAFPHRNGLDDLFFVVSKKMCRRPGFVVAKSTL